jgi:hypothetical protein
MALRGLRPIVPAGLGMVLHEGWSILTFADKPPLAGLLRYEHVGGTLHQWAIDVPAVKHHKGYTAIIAPEAVKSVTPCTEEEAASFVARPAPLRPPA